VSREQRVGIDIEIPSTKIERIRHKFLNAGEISKFDPELSGRNSILETLDSELLTILWSTKEAVFKWYGAGNVDFRQHIQLQKTNQGDDTIQCFFAKTNQRLVIHHHQFDHLVLAWIMNNGHDVRA
jgi:phosphopantetheinyl transferase